VHRESCGGVTRECPFHFAGCTVRMRYNDLDAHMHGAAQVHHLARLSIEPDAISHVMALLCSRTYDAEDCVKLAAVRALRYLSRKSHVAAVRAGAFVALVALLSGNSIVAVKDEAADAIVDLSHSLIFYTRDRIDFYAAAVSLAGIVPLFEVFAGRSAVNVKLAATAVLLLLSHGTTSRVDIVNDGAISVLARLLLADEGFYIKATATQALVRLSFDDINRAAIVSAGAVPGLVGMLLSGLATRMGVDELEGALAATEALYILSTCDANRLAIVNAGAIPPLLSLIVDVSFGFIELERCAAMALKNLADGITHVATRVVN
jgi:hypothetical protein